MEDLNYLLSREQEELLRAQNSQSVSARAAHHGMARGYAARIRDHHLPYRSPVDHGRIAFESPVHSAQAAQ